MSTIWKYALQHPRTELEMPVGATLLTVQMQGNTPMLWAQIWPGKPIERRVLDVYGTGHIMPLDPGKYVATFQTGGGALVWHVFDATLRRNSATERSCDD